MSTLRARRMQSEYAGTHPNHAFGLVPRKVRNVGCTVKMLPNAMTTISAYNTEPMLFCMGANYAPQLPVSHTRLHSIDGTVQALICHLHKLTVPESLLGKYFLTVLCNSSESNSPFENGTARKKAGYILGKSCHKCSSDLRIHTLQYIEATGRFYSLVQSP